MIMYSPDPTLYLNVQHVSQGSAFGTPMMHWGRANLTAICIMPLGSQKQIPDCPFKFTFSLESFFYVCNVIFKYLLCVLFKRLLW